MGLCGEKPAFIICRKTHISPPDGVSFGVGSQTHETRKIGASFFEETNMVKLIDVKGTIETESDSWMKDFLDWIKLRGEVYGGTIHERGSDVQYGGVS